MAPSRRITAITAALCGAVLCANASSEASASSCTVRVSPSTPDALHDAQRQVRTLLRDAAADIVVCLEPGVYRVSPGNHLRLTHEDAPRAGTRVVWRPAPGAPPRSVSISGGEQLTGWTQVTFQGGPAYQASLPSYSPAVRQLWVDDARASRVISRPAASAFGGSLKAWTGAGGAAGFIAASFPAGFGVDANATAAVEFTWPIIIKNWQSPRCTVASADPATLNITLANPCSAHMLARANPVPVPVTAEAVPGLGPLSPGTFYHDVTGMRILYSLAPGQSPSDLETSAFISNTEVLIEAANTTNHAWQGVAFQYSTWLQPNSPDGYVDDQSAVFDCSPTYTPTCNGGSAEPLGSVRVSTSSSISFTGCSFTHIGGPMALSIDKGSQNCVVSACNFTDLSGGFLKLGSVDTRYASSTDPADWDSGSVVTDCTADNQAEEYMGAAGLFAGYLVNASVVHNTVSDSGYSGMSMGWGWGASFMVGVGGNLIASNRMARVMSKLRDGGGIYVNGATNLTFGHSYATNNWVDTDEAVFAVFYLDNGASNWIFDGNVASNASLAWAGFLQGCCNLPAIESTITNIYYSDALDPVNNCANKGCVLENVTKVPNDQWPPAAQTIMAESGARPSRVALAAAGQWERLEASARDFSDPRVRE
jgi:hypothetical protein